MSKFVPSPQEVALVNQIFTQTDSQKLGVVTGEAAVKVFSGSKLPGNILAEVWNLADEDSKGVLTRKDAAVAVRLLGHAQRGETLSEALIHKPGAPPSIEGLNVPISGQGTGVRSARSPPPGPGSALPPLTAQDKAKFTKLFLGYGPQNGLLPGDKARDIFVKSKLPVDKLSQIWSLADTKHRGSLDVIDFTIAMYLIQGSMSGTLPTIPPVLPPYVYEQAKSGSDAVVSHATGGSASFSPGLTGGFPSRPVQPQYTGQGILQPQYTGQGILQPQSTGSRPTPPIPPRHHNVSNLSNLTNSPFSIPPQSTSQQWDVTPAEKASADSFFDSLDTQKRGYIEGDVAVPFMLQSKLSDDILAQIWDLSDMDNNGQLTRDGFAVAFHLIQSKLAGKELPTALPQSLVPPAKRGNIVAAVPPQSQVPDAIKDLLWDDTPPQSAVTQPTPPTLQPQRTGATSPPHAAQPTQPAYPASSVFGGTDPFATASSPFATTSSSFTTASSPFTTATTSSPFTIPAAAPPPPTAHRDLLGDDEDAVAASPPLQDKSAEIGNVQNQVNSTKRALETVKQEREDLERRVAEQESQLSSLQTQLSSSKAAYETETHTLSTLRDRYSTQTAEIQKSRQELIHAESNLSAIREERNEISGGLLRDKDEVRELQRKMTEVGLEVESLKAEVEKVKKEAKQQKGLLAIAKKQLATREAERAKIAKELEEAQAEAAQAAKEREEAEAELAKVPEAPAPAPERVASPAQSITSFAAAQPLPLSPETTPSRVSSPVSTKSNNPFERLALGGSPRPESPFLPFTGPPTSGIAEPTPTPAPPAPVSPVAETSHPVDPFGFDDAFGGDESKPLDEEPRTATTVQEGSPFGQPVQDKEDEHARDSSFDVTSPTGTELFHTPPSTAVPDFSGSVVSTPAPVAELKEPEPTTAASPVSPAVSEPKEQGKGEEQTDLNTQLKELEINESDSDSDEDDNEPLNAVKAKLAESHSGNSPTSKFDDVFGASSTEPSAPEPTPEQPTAVDTTPKAPAVPFTAPEAPKENGNADSAAPAGVNDFDEAMGLSGTGTNASQFSHVSQFTFDSAFDDDFDFAAAKAATGGQAVNGTSTAAPAPAATLTPTTTSYFPPVGAAGPSVVQAPATSSFPAAPSAAVRPKSEAFDAIFLPQANHVPPPVLAAPSQSISFDDAFSAGSSANKTAPVVQPTISNGTHGISFDDAFGGAPSESLALDESFTSSTQSQHYAPPNSPPPGLKGTPFPTSSTPASPTGDAHSIRRSISPAPRTSSPPPRPKSRPSTGSSEKEGKEKARHSKLSIRLPFGRKKAKHEPMPSQLSHSLLVEEPTNGATPAAEDDIEAVKTLCGMGFSRTQAVTALEQYDYDVQRALNSLLGTR